MKKLLLSSLVATSIVALAYTQTDVGNATYLAEKNIITKQIYETKYRLDDSITRAEVVGIALKMRGEALPESYTCKNYFSDVKFVPFSSDQWICRAVELAADAGFVSRTNRVFRSQDKITRAEALAILIKAARISDLTEEQITEMDKKYEYHFFDGIEGISWQSELIRKALYYSIIKPMTEINPGGTLNVYFYPNRVATRAEVFGFAKNILEYKAKTVSGEVNI